MQTKTSSQKLKLYLNPILTPDWLIFMLGSLVRKNMLLLYPLSLLQNNVLCHSERSEESYIAMYLLRFLPLVEMTKFLFCSFCKRLHCNALPQSTGVLQRSLEIFDWHCTLDSRSTYLWWWALYPRALITFTKPDRRKKKCVNIMLLLSLLNGGVAWKS